MKDARVLYRREPSPAHRQLLAGACLARAEHLQRAGMIRQAQDTLRELLQDVGHKNLELLVLTQLLTGQYAAALESMTSSESGRGKAFAHRTSNIECHVN